MQQQVLLQVECEKIIMLNCFSLIIMSESIMELLEIIRHCQQCLEEQTYAKDQPVQASIAWLSQGLY